MGPARLIPTPAKKTPNQPGRIPTNEQTPGAATASAKLGAAILFAGGRNVGIALAKRQEPVRTRPRESLAEIDACSPPEALDE